MILTKTYEINFIDMDSAILEIAEDIKRGYTIYEIKQLPVELSYSEIPKAAFAITLKNKKVDKI
jgi:hypothetical protein